MLIKILERSATTEAKGNLRCAVFSQSVGLPVSGAKIRLTAGGGVAAFEQLISNQDGQTATIDLAAPPLDYSLGTATGEQPYSEYDISVEAEGFEAAVIKGVQILPDVTAVQSVKLVPKVLVHAPESIAVIKPHTLWGNFPPKIPEADEKPLPEATGFVVLDKPVIPEIIVVHDGLPDNAAAKKHWVPFKDYINNVASSEIYATWPRETIAANVLAILSFTLNRVFTEWYRSKGKDFTITSSTAFDHAFVPGRNIFTEISSVVDEIFATYITRPGIVQPLFTQYCDGKRVTCPNWMAQWGSKDLGDKGYNALNILRNYYGSDIFLETAAKVAGVPVSYPGKQLTVGASGKDVRTIQNQLNTIAESYPGIKKQAADGVYGQATADAVRAFQGIFNMPVTGIVDFATWYRISDVFVAVSGFAQGIQPR
ncbi:MAG: peptidoglycan-binding protein [Defluviitaleaceae bacterium]|nr:peptidoglycan-binding protein [Defluviitaleaceae bacterium]